MTGRRTPTGEFVQSLDRGLAVIRAFGRDNPALSVAEVAAATGLGRATARRLLHTLETLGYVRGDGSRYVLAPPVLALGYSYLSSLTLPKIAGPHLEALAARSGESCSLAVLDGTDVVYVARASRKRIMIASISVGTRFPAWVTALGRVLMAAQPDAWVDEYLASTPLRQYTENTVTDADRLRDIVGVARARGYAVVDRELEPLLRSIAAPVRGSDGAVVAALNISSNAAARLARDHQALLPLLLRTVAELERDVRAGRLTALRPSWGPRDELVTNESIDATRGPR